MTESAATRLAGSQPETGLQATTGAQGPPPVGRGLLLGQSPPQHTPPEIWNLGPYPVIHFLSCKNNSPQTSWLKTNIFSPKPQGPGAPAFKAKSEPRPAPHTSVPGCAGDAYTRRLGRVHGGTGCCRHSSHARGRGGRSRPAQAEPAWLLWSWGGGFWGVGAASPPVLGTLCWRQPLWDELDPHPTPHAPPPFPDGQKDPSCNSRCKHTQFCPGPRAPLK